MPKSAENLKGWQLRSVHALKAVLMSSRTLVTITFCCSLVWLEAFHEQASFLFEILASGWNLLEMFVFGKNLAGPELRRADALKQA